MAPKRRRPDIVEPMKLRCKAHPYYRGDRKPECPDCLKIWNTVNKAQEEYFEEMRKRTTGKEKA
jgi:hypothetical protein